MKTTLADPRVRRIAVLAAVNLVLAVGGWVALVSPQRSHAASAQQQLQSVQSQQQAIAAVTTPVAPKTPVIHTAPEYVLGHVMPVTEDEPDLLLTVDEVARAAGVHVLTLSPQTAVQAVGYTTLPLQLNVGGSYAQITRFMAELRTLVAVRHDRLYGTGRLFSVQQISLQPATTGHGLLANMTVDSYVFGQVAGATPLPVTVPTTTSTGTTTTSTTSTTTAGG